MALDEEGGENFFNHVMSLWVAPEIKRRKENGTLSDNFAIDKIQVLISPEKKPVIVRLNDEIKAQLVCKFRPSIHKQVIGEPVYWKDIDDILDIKLTEHDDPDAAHITMVLFREGWKIKFDLRNNKRRAKELYDSAREFLNSAKKALDDASMRVFSDNLFSTVELFVTSQLFVMSEYEYVRKPTHAWTQKKYNEFINIGNYKEEYKNIFNKLSGLRSGARYHKQPFKLNLDDAKGMLKVAEDLGEYTKKVILIRHTIEQGILPTLMYYLAVRSTIIKDKINVTPS